MINLPFNLKTLSFYDKEYEEMYESHIDNFRVTSFKLLTAIVCFICLAFLIVFLIE